MVKRMNKKGGTVEILIIFFILVVLGLSFPILYSHLSPVLSSFAESDGISQGGKDVLNNFNAKFPKMLDNMFLIVLIFSWLSAVILSLFIDSHPIVLVISWFILIIILWTAMFFGNFMEQFLNQDGLALSRTDLPIIVFVSSHVVEFMLAISLSVLLALFGKSRFRGGAM